MIWILKAFGANDDGDDDDDDNNFDATNKVINILLFPQ